MPRIPLLPALLLATAVALTGCSGAGMHDKAASGPTGSAASDRASTDEPVDAEEPVDADPTPGVVETGLVRFSVPDDWAVLNADELFAGLDGDELVENDEAAGELSDRLGIDGDQLRQLMGQTEVIALSPDGVVDGQIDSVNVLSMPGSVPNRTQMTAQLTALGAEIVDISHVDTPAGEALAAAYRLELGAATMNGRMTVVGVAGSAVVVTTSAHSADTADAAQAEVLETIEPVDRPTT